VLIKQPGTLCGTWRVEQPNDNPDVRMPVERAHIEVGIVFLDHVRFVPLPEFLFPPISVVRSPFSVRLPHLPIRADDLVSLAPIVLTAKLVAKAERYFLQFFLGVLNEQMTLSQ